jgi:hypothetical protein
MARPSGRCGRSDPGLIVEVRKKVVRMRTHEPVHDPVAGIPTQETRPGGGRDPDPPRGRGLTIAVVIATVTAMVLVAITGAAMIDQRNQIEDRDAAVAAALVQRDRPQASVVAPSGSRPCRRRSPPPPPGSKR